MGSMAILMSEQLSVLLGALLLGAVLGCVYDFFRVTRLAFIIPALLILAQDLLFFLFSSIILFSYLLRTSDGQMRYFIFVGAVAGWAAYYFSIGKLVMSFSEAIIGFVRSMIDLLMRPVHWVWGHIVRIWTYIKEAVLANMIKLKNSLKFRVVMMYNKKKNRLMTDKRRADAVAQAASKAKPKNKLDFILQLLTIALLILLVVFLMKTTLSYASMKNQLAQKQAQAEEQRLINKDLELALRDRETYMERMARERLGFALPWEQVFIDLSGMD